MRKVDLRVFIFELRHDVESSELINMAIWQRRVRLCVLAAVAFLAGPILARTETGAEEAVRAVLERQVADWNRGDLDAFLNCDLSQAARRVEDHPRPYFGPRAFPPRAGRETGSGMSCSDSGARWHPGLGGRSRRSANGAVACHGG